MPQNSHMPEISKLLRLSDLRNAVLRERAERGHCPKSHEFIASMNGEEAGLLSYEDWSEKELGFIYEIFVLPSFRRQGIGEFLLTQAESYAHKIGCKSVRLKPYPLEQEPDRNRLIAWYAKTGYRRMTDAPELMEKHLRT